MACMDVCRQAYCMFSRETGADAVLWWWSDRRKWPRLARVRGQFGQFDSWNVTFYAVDVCWVYLAVCCSGSHQTSPSSCNALCRYLPMVLQRILSVHGDVGSSVGRCGGFHDGYFCEYLKKVHQHFIHVNKFIPSLWDVFFFFSFFLYVYLYIQYIYIFSHSGQSEWMFIFLFHFAFG